MDVPLNPDFVRLQPILPPEIWKLVAKQLLKVGSDDVENLANSSVFFQNLLESERTIFLFEKVLPLVASSIWEKEGLQGLPVSDVLKLRGVCPHWNAVIDKLIPEQYQDQEAADVDNAIVVSQSRSPLSGQIEEMEISDGEEVDVSHNPIPSGRAPLNDFNLTNFLTSDQFVPGPFRPKVKKPDKQYVYHTLEELAVKLKDSIAEDVAKGVVPNLMIKECNTYGIVVEMKNQVRDENAYYVRISDETRNSVLLRVHRGKDQIHGPRIEIGNVIRVHRLTAHIEWDTGVSKNTMVLSTAAHHNYVLFEQSNEPKTCAKTVTLSGKWHEPPAVMQVSERASDVAVGEDDTQSNSRLNLDESRSQAVSNSAARYLDQPGDNYSQSFTFTFFKDLRMTNEPLNLLCQIVSLNEHREGTWCLILKDLEQTVPSDNFKQPQSSVANPSGCQLGVNIKNGIGLEKRGLLSMLQESQGTAEFYFIPNVTIKGIQPPYTLEIDGNSCGIRKYEHLMRVLKMDDPSNITPGLCSTANPQEGASSNTVPDNIIDEQFQIVEDMNSSGVVAFDSQSQSI